MGRMYYGWVVVAAACVVYGFGIGPAYVSWGFLAPEMIADTGLSREAVGGVFGLFTFCYNFSGLFVALLYRRWGIRNLMAIGAACSAAGFFLMSRANTAWDCYLAFAVLGGGGVGMATIVPCQTLGQNWFLRRRALVLGIILASGGLVLSLYPQINRVVLHYGSWRDAWLLMGLISTGLVLGALLVIRDTPESMGLCRDGVATESSGARLYRKRFLCATDDRWTARQTFRQYQFTLLLGCGIAYALPWNVMMAHGRLFLHDQGLDMALVASVLSTMALMSIGGRLTGIVGDWIPPQAVLAVSLALEGTAMLGMLFVTSPGPAYVCGIALGLGFGGAFVSIPVVFTYFFGRNAFLTTGAVRIMLAGTVTSLGPWLAGRYYDATQTYNLPFLAVACLAFAGAASAALCRHPGPATTAPDETMTCTVGSVESEWEYKKDRRAAVLSSFSRFHRNGAKGEPPSSAPAEKPR